MTSSIAAEATTPTSSGLRQIAAKGIAWSAFQVLGSRISSIATFIVLAHLLDPSAFGLVALASVVIAFLTIFVSQGFGAVIVQATTVEKRNLDTAFWVSLAFGCLLAGITVAASGPFAELVGVPEAAPVLRVLSVAFVLSGLSSVQQGLLQRRMAFRSLAIRSTVSSLVGALVGVTAALLGAGVWALVAQTLSAAAVGVVALWLSTGWRPGRNVDRATYREMFGFSRNVLGVNVAAFFLRRTDDFFIGAFLGPVSLGIYTVAYRLVVLLMDMSISTVGSVALPTFSRLQHDRPRLRRAYMTATRLSAVVALPTFGFLIVAAPELVAVFFGPQWSGSVPVMRVLALIGVANTLTNFNATVMTALGRPELAMRFLLIASVANVVGVAVAVHWGIFAVAVALVLRNCLVGSPLSIYLVRRLLGFSLVEYFIGYVTPACAALCGMAAAALAGVTLSGIAGDATRLAVMLAAAGVAHIAALRLLDRRLLVELAGQARAMVASRRRPTLRPEGTA